MQFCERCESLLDPDSSGTLCDSCAPDDASTQNDARPIEDGGTKRSDSSDGTELERLPTTDSGAVKKREAVQWMESLDNPTDEEIQSVIIPKREGFTGSTYPTEISNIRVTGDAAFIETIAGRFKPFLEMEDHRYRLEINLQETEDRDTGESTGNYALYLSVAERG